MAKDKIKLALVGAGYWGKNLIRVFSELSVLDTVCDLDLDELRRVKKEYPKVNISSAYSDVLKDNSIRAIVIATPAQTHYRLAKEAILSGKDVFVEKPLATTITEGRELIGLAKKRKAVLMVGHILEYHPAVVKLKELIEKGALGKIQYIYSSRLNLGKIRKEENILWSFAPHDISAILLLLNEMPQTVSVWGGNYIHKDIADVTVTNMVFASGIKGHIFVSWLHPYKEQKLVIIGDKKMAVFDDTAPKDKLLLYSHKIEWIDRMPVTRKKDAQAVTFRTKEPLLVECRHFIQCLKERKKAKTDGESALRVLNVLQACQSSLLSNGIAMPLGSFYAHPTSVVEQPCVIGENTRVWHYSHVMKNAIIGKDCNIGQNVFIGSRAVLGNNVKVQNNVSIYDCVHLDDDVFCGPSVVFTNVINPRSQVLRKDEFKPTFIKKGATLGANSTIICGKIIGEYAFVGAGAVVTKDVPAYALVYGNPARIKGWICKCGIKLKGVGEKAKCDSCGRRYEVKGEEIKCIAER